MHFDTPESPKVLSLNQLASGMNRKRAACLFYQTCGINSSSQVPFLVKKSSNAFQFCCIDKDSNKWLLLRAVLASREFARVEQKVAYGDILVSRGAKM